MYTQKPKSNFLVFAFMLFACVEGSTDEQPSDADSASDSDLPCGGADLQTDNLNCGTCGNKCPVDNPGTPYEVGTCDSGTCGPVWYEEQFDPVSLYGPPPPDLTCEEICAGYSTSCVAQGCSGKTGYVCSSLFGEGCSLTTPDIFPMDWFGECDEVVPWVEFDGGSIPRLGCCCWFKP